jgi:predicted transcriptional regulator
MINNDLEIRIKAISESDNVLKALNAQIKEVTNELNKLHMQGKQGTAEWNSYKSTLDGLISKKNQLKEATTGVSTGLSGMMSQLNAIKTGVYAQLFIEIAEAVVAVGRAVINAAKEVLNFALTGARFSELKKHFEDVRGGADNAEKSMKLFRQAAAGEMSDAELIKYANTMRDLGHSDEETAKILDFSEKVVKNYGGTMEEAEAKVRRFLETGKAKGFEGMAVSIRQVTEDAKKLAIQQGYNYEKLDDESKLVLKTTAFYNRYSSSN